MASWTRLSTTEQLTNHLRDELLRGRWHDSIPGVVKLSTDNGVNAKTVEGALANLEREKLIISQGPGKRRLIVESKILPSNKLRVALLNYEPLDRSGNFMCELQHKLDEAGHTSFFTKTSLIGLGMNPKRVVRFVRKLNTDALVVTSGSREILSELANENIPTFAHCGRRLGLPIAATGPNKIPAYQEVARRMIELGHQRIVLLARTPRRLPIIGTLEQSFLNELQVHGIKTGPYNLPHWDDTIEGFTTVLDSLFGKTPPTAILVDEVALFLATQQFLASRGIRSPREISLACTDASSDFSWFSPAVAHIKWDSRPMARRIVGWANNISRGKTDLRQTLIKAEFVDGGTLAPVKK